MQQPPFRLPSESPLPPARRQRLKPALPAMRPPLPTTRPMTPNEFNAALVHLYRGEVTRANTWRLRLDGTTNWAVVTTGATLSFAFSGPTNTPVMILLNSLLIVFFLYIEARRYRYYDLWRTRVRVIETEFFADMLAPQSESDADSKEHWRELLSRDLNEPQFNVSIWEAMGKRLRRNYSWMFGLLALSWFIKIGIHPTVPRSFEEFYQRAAVGPLPAWLIFLLGLAFNGFLLALALTSGSMLSGLSGEILSRSEARDKMGSRAEGVVEVLDD